MLAAPFDSADADKFDAAFTRKRRTGLGFTAQPNPPTHTAPYQTQAERELLTPSATAASSTPAFSAAAYLARFGWRAGSGLGRLQDGAVGYVKVSKKDDQAGIGAGLAVQAIARSFESVFNNAARNFNVVIQPDTDDDDEEARERQQDDETKEASDDEQTGQRKDEEDRRAKKTKKKDRKRKRLEEEKEERKQPTSDNSDDDSPISAVASSSPPTAPPAALRPHITFHKSTSLTSTTNTTHHTLHPLHTPTTAPDRLANHDPTRPPMYHDRCRGKLARLEAQEGIGWRIVEAVRSKRWDGLQAGQAGKGGDGDEQRIGERPMEQTVEQAMGEEERMEKRKAERRERKRREQEVVQLAEQERKEAPPSTEAVDDEEKAERKRRKLEKKEAKRRQQMQ